MLLSAVAAAARASLLCSVLLGCATSTTLPMDAGRDAPPSADVGIDVNAPDTHCDLSPEPTPPPPFVGDFQLNDAAFGAVAPVMTGGDPLGTWVFDRGTFWVDRENNAMFNRYASSVAGTAWIVIEPTEFRLDYDFITTLAGTEAGTVVQDNHTRLRARWRLDREQIEPTGLACAEASAVGCGDPGRVTFSRVDADHIVVLTVVPMEVGMTLIELHGTRVP